MVIERPLDFLNELKTQKVLVVTKGNNPDIKGKLLAFDIHLNLVVETSDGMKFVRGDIVEVVQGVKDESK